MNPQKAEPAAFAWVRAALRSMRPGHSADGSIAGKWLAAFPIPYWTVLLFGLAAIARVVISGAEALAMPEIHVGLANKDFANYWVAAQLVLSGETADLFGPHAGYFAHLTAIFGPDYPWHNWSYPPHYLLLIWPLGFFGYKTALIVFLLSTLGIFLWTARSLTDRNSALVWVAILPFIAHTLLVAQNGFLFGGLALGALALRDRRPVVAGIFLALLTVKPQLGVLFPFLLLAERRWLVIAVAAAGTLVLVLGSIALFGVSAWQGYFAEVVPYQSQVMAKLDGTFLTLLTSFYALFRNWGLEAAYALPLHLIFALPVFLITIGAFFLASRNEDRTILLLVATFLITPYALTYDLGMLAGALGLLAMRVRTKTMAPNILLAIAMLLPVLMRHMGEFNLALAPVIIFLVYLLALREAGTVGSARRAWMSLNAARRNWAISRKTA